MVGGSGVGWVFFRYECVDDWKRLCLVIEIGY